MSGDREKETQAFLKADKSGKLRSTNEVSKGSEVICIHERENSEKYTYIENTYEDLSDGELFMRIVDGLYNDLERWRICCLKNYNFLN